MVQKGFKVVMGKKHLIGVWTPILIFEFLLVILIIYTDLDIISIIFAVGLLILGVSAVFSAVMFDVDVDGTIVKVRNRRGQKYEFSCSDIEEVICTQENSVKYGPSFSMTVITKSHELSMVYTMIGFQDMAGYLLEKYESGEIRHKAISEGCKRKLRQYRNGDIYKKKRQK